MSDKTDPETTYEQICKQIDRETLLSRSRNNTCIFLNAGLGTAASSQISRVSESSISLILIEACCLVGFLVTEGFQNEMKAGYAQAHKAGYAQAHYLYRKFESLEHFYPGQFVRPYYEPDPKLNRVPDFFSDIPTIFQSLWIFSAIFSLLLRFGIFSL